MVRRLIDISVSLRADVASDPADLWPKIEYLDHHDTAPKYAKFFGINVDQFPDGEFCASERCEITTHHGTHLDAPFHYASRMNMELVPGGEAALRIDEVPLEWCYQPGVKLDFRHVENGCVLTASDIEAELKRIGHTIKPLEIVLINTRAGARYGHDDYVASGCGVGRDATLWLLRQGVRLVGTDAWGWDAPMPYMKKAYQETGDASVLWEGHKAGREIGYSHLEKLSNLEKLPSAGFDVVCFPVKVHRASAGWTRAVAIVDE